MANTFRDQMMRQNYDAAVDGWRTKHRNFFRPDGGQRRGSSMAENFWRGFDGQPGFGAGFIDRASRQTLAYAYWRAGQDCRKEADGAKKPGRPALPPDQAQTAMIRERVTPAQRQEYEARGGKAWLVAALNRKRK